jgi:hypothetical protein
MNPTQRKLSGAALVILALVLFVAGSSPMEDDGPVAVAAEITPTLPVPTATSQSLATATAAVPTVTPSPRATSTPTVLPSPTMTPTPTFTPTPSPTATPTVTPTPTATPTPTETPTPEPSPTPDPAVVEAVVAVQEFNPGDPATLARLDDVISRGGNVIPSLEFLLRDENPDRRYAALYVIVPLTRTAEDVAVLKVALDDPNPGFRVVAAGALIGRGVVESIPVLIDGLSLQQGLPYSDPPRPLAQFSRQTLEFYTGESFATPEAWRAWWDSVHDRIYWTGAGYDVR